MIDNKEVMDWAVSICEQVLTESRASGSPALANRLLGNQSIAKFFNMVHGQRAVKAHEFQAYYVGDWKEIKRLYEAYLAETDTSEKLDKIDALEARFDKLESMLTAFIEGQKPATATVTEGTLGTIAKMNEHVREELSKNKGGKKPAKTEVVEADAVVAEPEKEADKDEDEADVEVAAPVVTPEPPAAEIESEA